jgi:hypothetical protein
MTERASGARPVLVRPHKISGHASPVTPGAKRRHPVVVCPALPPSPAVASVILGREAAGLWSRPPARAPRDLTMGTLDLEGFRGPMEVFRQGEAGASHREGEEVPVDDSGKSTGPPGGKIDLFLRIQVLLSTLPIHPPSIGFARCRRRLSNDFLPRWFVHACIMSLKHSG